MKKYYLHDGSEQDGPFDISELKSKGITAETEVWFEGLSDWEEAGKIDELSVLFEKTTPPPIRPKPSSSKSNKKSNKRNKIKLLALIILAVIVGFIIVRVVFNNGSNSYFEQKLTIKQTEKSNPLRFLTIEGNYRESFWGTKFKLRGKITNTATIAAYKDVVVKITYYSKTKTVLGSNNYTIYKVFPPNKVTDFKLDVENYKDVSSIGLDLVNAKPN